MIIISQETFIFVRKQKEIFTGKLVGLPINQTCHLEFVALDGNLVKLSTKCHRSDIV